MSLGTGPASQERFVLEDRLGHGAMGEVYRARDTRTGRVVALKIMLAQLADDPQYRERLAREAELARRIDSPNVVKVLGYGIRDGAPFLALEFIEGRTLAEELRRHGPYDWTETRALVGQIATGLAAAHDAGVIHRDVKPSNILVTADGIAKLSDFGIAKGLDLSKLTASAAVLGTPTYLAPEGPKDPRSDLYALGVIAYELLTGVPPFTGGSHQAVILAHVTQPPDLTRLPVEARPLVAALLSKRPESRPQSARAVLSFLQLAASPPGGRGGRGHQAAAMAPTQVGGYDGPFAGAFGGPFGGAPSAAEQERLRSMPELAPIPGVPSGARRRRRGRTLEWVVLLGLVVIGALLGLRIAPASAATRVGSGPSPVGVYAATTWATPG